MVERLGFQTLDLKVECQKPVCWQIALDKLLTPRSSLFTKLHKLLPNDWLGVR